MMSVILKGRKIKTTFKMILTGLLIGLTLYLLCYHHHESGDHDEERCSLCIMAVSMALLVILLYAGPIQSAIIISPQFRPFVVPFWHGSKFIPLRGPPFANLYSY